MVSRLVSGQQDASNNVLTQLASHIWLATVCWWQATTTWLAGNTWLASLASHNVHCSPGQSLVPRLHEKAHTKQTWNKHIQKHVQDVCSKFASRLLHRVNRV